ncbi:MAG: ABC transporter permease [Tissierellia bacterium]|nr:ABC transporter permease [Tissierellia bacterium]
MIAWVMENWARILEKMGQHIFISLSALIIGTLIAVPIGIMLTRSKKLSQVIISVASVLQTLPSLALLAIMVPIIGVGRTPAIVALVIYSLLPILRNTYLGVTSVDEDILDACRGMGLTEMQIIKQVQVPLAMPVIMSGIQLSAVYLVSWATIASYIGAGGLGDLIFMGLNNFNFYAILSGTIPVTLIALFMDLSIGKLKEKISPRMVRKEVIINEK